MNQFQIPVIDMEATGARIRELRYANQITVHQLADSLGVSEQAVKKWQRGACLPSLDNVIALGRIFHTSIESLIVMDEALSVCIGGTTGNLDRF